MILDSGTLLTFIEHYGMIAVFAAIMLEYACFPVPSEIVLPFAGAYASVCGEPFWKILAVSIAAGLCGCMICYLIGYYGGAPLLERVQRRHKKMAGGVKASRQWFEKYGGISVLIGRVLPLCRTYISFIAGLSRQNVLQFAGLSAIGIAVWNTVLVGLGFKLADHWDKIALYAKRYTYILLPAVILLLFAVVCQIRKRAKNENTGE